MQRLCGHMMSALMLVLAGIPAMAQEVSAGNSTIDIPDVIRGAEVMILYATSKIAGVGVDPHKLTIYSVNKTPAADIVELSEEANDIFPKTDPGDSSVDAGNTAPENDLVVIHVESDIAPEANPEESQVPSDSALWKTDIEGMLAAWLTASHSNTLNAQGGIRYIPGLSAGYTFRNSLKLDAEASVNAYGASTFWGDDSIGQEAGLKPYRMWLRFSGNRFELRAGLQKVNFGSAVMLRPLMWFDQIDPRDPLQLTDGVYALLGRYYFLNNANIWLWGLYGNTGNKGWEIVPSDNKKIEYGGRVQVPVLTVGELALTGHHRAADYQGMDVTDTRTGGTSVSENRIGLDGKFDLEVGVWFEGTLTRQRIEDRPFTRSLNLGLDYTFDLGNGLHMMVEYLSFSTASQLLGPAHSFRLSALSASYPLSIFTSLNAIVFYDTDNRNLYNFISWSWQFDDWSLYLIGFWNPDRFEIYQNMEGASLFAGKGIQLMFVYNH